MGTATAMGGGMFSGGAQRRSASEHRNGGSADDGGGVGRSGCVASTGFGCSGARNFLKHW